MAQSYGNLSTSVITAAVDEVLGVSSVMQNLGTAMSAENPADTLSAGLTLSINLDGDGAQVIILDAHSNLLDTAADIQAEVRALTAIGFADQSAFDDFECRWDQTLNKLVMTTGTALVQPPAYTQTPSVVIGGGTAANDLKLGLAEGGTESYTGSEVISYTVKYRFVFGAGRSFGSADVVVNSSEMTTPTSLAEVSTLANARAAQLKDEQELVTFTSSDYVSLNGPVSL